MLFNSIPYLFFLPVTLLVYRIISLAYRHYFLLFVSYVFYAWYNPWFSLLLFSTTMVDFFCGNKISDSPNAKNKKAWLVFSIGSNIAVLFFFKYAVFFANTGIGLLNWIGYTQYSFFNQLIIPAGLSFYTFQSLAYIIDIYRKKINPAKNFSEYALFVSFFPQLVAGPVERFQNLSPQINQPTTTKMVDYPLAMRLITWGFFKKMVLADRLADLINPVFTSLELYSGSTLLLFGFLFAVQVYGDFSGYTDIASGTAKLFGINLCLNWRRPLLSTSVANFWKRNHISITSWFRDYLYISLGGNKVKKTRWALNILIVFLISGLWHGANWTFIVWAILHAVFFLLEYFVSEKYKFNFPAFTSWLYFILFHSFSMLAFRANSINDLWEIYSSVCMNFDLFAFKNELLSLQHLFPLMLTGGVILLFFMKELQEEFNFFRLNNLSRSVFYISILLLIFLIGNFNANEFVYFQF